MSSKIFELCRSRNSWNRTCWMCSCGMVGTSRIQAWHVQKRLNHSGSVLPDGNLQLLQFECRNLHIWITSVSSRFLCEMLDVAEDFSRPSLLLAPIELLSPKRRELNKETAFQFLPSRDSRDQSQFDSPWFPIISILGLMQRSSKMGWTTTLLLTTLN